MYLSVIVPVYNEAAVIKETLRKIDNYLKSKNWLSEIIVVNDGSSDGSLTEINQFKLGNLKVISFKENQGKGAAVKAGLLAAGGELLLFLDADYSTAIDELDNFLPAIDEGYDIVIGSRAVAGAKIIVAQPKTKEWLGRLGNKLIQWLALPGIKDTQCGFKLFTKRFQPYFKKQTIKRWSFDFELLFIARKYNFRILEMPVNWTNDPFSKVKLWDYPKTFFGLIKIRLNNLRRIYDES
jgi:dolichyl-phosphate beta-glucosyltransferase